MTNINPLNTLYYSLGKLEQNHYMRYFLRRVPMWKGSELQLKKVKTKGSWCIKWCYPISKGGFTLRQGGSQARARKLPVILRHLYDCSDGTLKASLPLYGVMNKDTMLPLMRLLPLELDHVLFGKIWFSSIVQWLHIFSPRFQVHFHGSFTLFFPQVEKYNNKVLYIMSNLHCQAQERSRT